MLTRRAPPERTFIQGKNCRPIGICGDHLFVLGREHDYDEQKPPDDYIYAYNTLTGTWKAPMAIEDSTEEQVLANLIWENLFAQFFTFHQPAGNGEQVIVEDGPTISRQFLFHDHFYDGGQRPTFYLVQFDEQHAEIVKLEVDDSDGSLLANGPELHGIGIGYVASEGRILFVIDTDVEVPGKWPENGRRMFAIYRIFQLRHLAGLKWSWSCLNTSDTQLQSLSDTALHFLDSLVSGLPDCRETIFCGTNKLVFLPTKLDVALDQAITFHLDTGLYQLEGISADPEHGCPLSDFSCSSTLAVYENRVYWPSECCYMSMEELGGQVQLSGRDEFWILDFSGPFLKWQRTFVAHSQKILHFLAAYASAMDESGEKLYLFDGIYQKDEVKKSNGRIAVFDPNNYERDESVPIPRIICLRMKPSKLVTLAMEALVRAFPPDFWAKMEDEKGFVPRYSNPLNLVKFIRANVL